MRTTRHTPLIAFLLPLLFIFQMSVCYGAGFTLITHGYSLWGSDDESWLESYVTAIQNRSGGTSTTVLELDDYLILNSGDIAHSVHYKHASGPLTLDQTSDGEVIMELNWSALARNLDENSRTSTEVASAVVTYLFAQHPEFLQLPIHLIGHSRGGSVVSEITRLLGASGIWVDHQTTLDPHPVNADGNSETLLCGTLTDASVAVYENTMFADNYWQNTWCGLPTYPAGESISGATNVNLNDRFYAYPTDFAVWADHLHVYDWYCGTINLDAPVLLSTPGYAMQRDLWYAPAEDNGTKAGYTYSRLGKGARPATGLNAHFGGSTFGQPITRDPTTGSQWPNVFNLNISDNQYATQTLPQYQIGTTLNLQFDYQSFGNQAFVCLYLDADQNPYNANSVDILGSLVSCPANGTGVSEKTAQWNTAGRSPGTYYLYAKIEDGFGHVRYVYAGKQIELVTTVHDLVFYTPSGWPSGFFLNNSSAGLASMTTFSPSDGIYVSFAFMDDEWHDISQSIGVRLVLTEYPPAFNYPPTYIGFNLPVTREFTWSSLQNGYYGYNRAWEWVFIDWYVLRNLPEGTYVISCTLNCANTIGENDYRNNTRTITFTVGQQCTVTFDTQGGTACVPQTYTVGSLYGTLPVTTRAGYSFDGWWTGANGSGTRITESSTVIGSTTVLYAGWIANTRVISLSGDMAFGEVPVGASTERLLTIANNGNSALTVTGINYPNGFSGGWSGAIPTGGSQNVTVLFAPTSPQDYGGVIVVNSDKTSGNSTTSCTGVGIAVAATPTFSPDGGIQPASVRVLDIAISCETEDATIRYTTDASEPSETSTVVPSGGMVSLPIPGTLKAKAWKAGMYVSATGSATYTSLPPLQLIAFATAEGICVEFSIVENQIQDANFATIDVSQNGALIVRRIVTQQGPNTYNVYREMFSELQASQCYDFIVYDEAGRPFYVNDVVVGAFAVNMVRVVASQMTLEWDSIPGRLYEVLQVDQLGGQFGPMPRPVIVVATTKRSSAVIQLDPLKSNGFFRISER